MAEWNASGYQSVSSLQEAIATELLSRLTLGEHDRILDLGCGNGKITAAIAQRVPQGSVLGVDASHNMISFAQKNYGAPVHANLHFEVSNARNLTYQHEFDRIVSFNAFHWIPEQDAVLHSMRLALKPEGQALVRFVPEGEREWAALITEVLDRYQALAADNPSENNTFKFYQMEVVLVPL